MAKARDPIVRLSKHDVLSPDVLDKAAQVLLDSRLRFVDRVRKLRFDERPSSADPEAHKLYLDDEPEVRLLHKLWLRYYMLLDSDDEGGAKLANELMKMICQTTSGLSEAQGKAFAMILAVVQQNQKAKEHADKMAVANRERPEDMSDASLDNLLETSE